MSHLEEIEKLKEDAASFYPGADVEHYIDRAVSLGGKFVRDRVEEAKSECEGGWQEGRELLPTNVREKVDILVELCLDTPLNAASQALSELDPKAIQLGVVEVDAETKKP